MIGNIGKVLIAGAFSMAAMSSAFAGASVSGVSGNVMVNSGAGYRTVGQASALKSGDRIMVGPNATATVKFDKGCSVALKPGQVLTIGSSDPCNVKAAIDGNASFLPLLLIGGGVAGIVGLSIGAGDQATKSP